MEKITILGLGNILLQDEGFGVNFVKWFEQRHRLPENVGILDGGVLGFNLLNTIADCDRLIVVDTIKTDDDPGSIYRFNREEMQLHMPDPTSAHEVEFFDVICMADLMGQCPETVFCCIVPQEYGGEMEMGMTPLMESRFEPMEALVLKELEAIGIAPEPADA